MRCRGVQEPSRISKMEFFAKKVTLIFTKIVTKIATFDRPTLCSRAAAEKVGFCIENFFRKHDQNQRKLRIINNLFEKKFEF